MNRQTFFTTIIVIELFMALGVFAGYIPLAPLPGGETKTDIETGQSGVYLTYYLQAVFSFGITVAAIAAVMSLVFAGVQYMTAYGNPAAISSAKERIINALFGLLLAISAWLILYTINPDLVKSGLLIPPI